jgi:hypothetical protein
MPFTEEPNAMAMKAPNGATSSGGIMADRRMQLLAAIDEIDRQQGHGANYRDLGGRLGLCVSYVRTLMLDHLREGFAEPIAGNPCRGWKLTAAGRKRLKAG